MKLHFLLQLPILFYFYSDSNHSFFMLCIEMKMNKNKIRYLRGTLEKNIMLTPVNCDYFVIELLKF